MSKYNKVTLSYLFILLLAFFILILNSCGSDEPERTYVEKEIKTGEQGPQGEAGPQGEPGEIKEIITYIEAEACVSLAGYYLLPDGGYIELLEDNEGRIVIYGTQRLYSTNFDDGLALHPTLPSGPHKVHDGRIIIDYMPTYSADTNDVEKDNTTRNIIDRRKTVVTFQLTEDDNLVILILIYSASGLQIEARRQIESI